jgi:uncharacterized tellurite resistance protein B-like protein
MNSVHTLEDLYEEYIDSRKLRITFSQFTHMVHFYPILLIISTDGKVDEKEWKYVQMLSNNLGDLYHTDIKDAELLNDLKEMYLNEFKYLLMNFDTWERKFMKTLRQHLAENPEKKEEVLQAMYLFASVSDGIHEKEEIMIEHVTKELGITHTL